MLFQVLAASVCIDVIRDTLLNSDLLMTSVRGQKATKGQSIKLEIANENGQIIVAVQSKKKRGSQDRKGRTGKRQGPPRKIYTNGEHRPT